MCFTKTFCENIQIDKNAFNIRNYVFFHVCDTIKKKTSLLMHSFKLLRIVRRLFIRVDTIGLIMFHDAHI